MTAREMEYRRLGESGPRVSAVCLGTMTFGQQNGEAEAHSQLDLAVERGIDFIDTAEMYPVPARAETSGETERIVGNWLARQAREKLVIATKVAGPARSLEWIRGGPLALDRANIRAAVEGSLRRLRTDYIDLYQLHWPARNQPLFGQLPFDPARERGCTPIHAQLEALAELVQEGKIRHVGMSDNHVFHFRGINVLSAGDDHVLDAILDVNEPLLVDHRHIKPALPQHFAIQAGQRAANDRRRIQNVADDLGFDATRVVHQPPCLVVHLAPRPRLGA